MNNDQTRLEILRDLLERIMHGESDEELRLMINLGDATDAYDEPVRQWMHEGIALMRGVHDGKFSREEFITSLEDLMRRGREIEP
jgi:hypothetical protein